MLTLNGCFQPNSHGWTDNSIAEVGLVNGSWVCAFVEAYIGSVKHSANISASRCESSAIVSIYGFIHIFFTKVTLQMWIIRRYRLLCQVFAFQVANWTSTGHHNTFSAFNERFLLAFLLFVWICSFTVGFFTQTMQPSVGKRKLCRACADSGCRWFTDRIWNVTYMVAAYSWKRFPNIPAYFCC